jgi:diguanylate cyclase (GGDEF)-like protein
MTALIGSDHNGGRLRSGRMSEHLRAILDTTREPLLVLDGGLRIRMVNKAFCQTFRHSAVKANGRLLTRLGTGAWKSPALAVWLNRLKKKRLEIPDCELKGHFPWLGQRAILLNARRVQYTGAKRRIILLTLTDVTQQNRADVAAEKLTTSLRNDSMTDMLTGLYNRRGYTVLSQIFLDLAHRRGKRIFVIYADVDGLKQVNDQAGHLKGDQLLVRTAHILRKTFRKSDVIARIGGDEFAIATMENGHDSAATQIARLHANLKRQAARIKEGNNISLSVGVSYSNPLGTSSIEKLISEADALMYIEKRAKADAVSAASPLVEPTLAVN